MCQHTRNAQLAEEFVDFNFPTVRAEELNGMIFAMLNETHLMQKELERHLFQLVIQRMI